jgi:hypothetical protein
MSAQTLGATLLRVPMTEALAEVAAPDRDVLVIASSPWGVRLGLRLDFRRARVVHAGPSWDVEGLAREVGPDASFDVVVIDGPELSLARRVALATRTRQVLRTGGSIVVPVSAASVRTADVASASQVRGLEWSSVAVIDGVPCMVFTPATWPDTPSPNASARIATMAATLAAYAPGDSASSSESRYASESALLAHLRLLSESLAAERRARLDLERHADELSAEQRELAKQHSRLRRSKLGRVTIRFWRLRRALTRRLRSRRGDSTEV